MDGEVNLRKADRGPMGISDPVCFLCDQVDGTGWRELGMTEVIMNNCDPQFVKKFYVKKITDETRLLKFKLYDVDKSGKKGFKIVESNFLGQYECDLQKLVGNLIIEGDLTGKQAKGQIRVVAEVERPQEKPKENLSLTLAVNNAKGTKHYTLISKEYEDSFIPIHRTESVDKRDHVRWDITVSIQALCNYDKERRLKFECFEDKNGSDKCLGEFHKTLAQLKGLRVPHKIYFETKKNQDKSLTATFMKVSTTVNHSFDEYIRGGTKILVSLAVDFTVSNKEYHQRPSSSSEEQLSVYARAIQIVGKILHDITYEYNMRPEQIKAYGFGAVLSDRDRVSELFGLNGSLRNPECSTTAEVLQHYNKTVENVTLDGPSNFAPVIEAVSRRAKGVKPNEQYHVLAIFTDGGIDDTVKTKQAIVKASKLPISIVIVGIGNKDFDAMRMLDSDEKPLRSSYTQCAMRDIVQKYDSHSPQAGQLKSIDHLRQEVLKELPEQFMACMKGDEVESMLPMMDSLRV